MTEPTSFPDKNTQQRIQGNFLNLIKAIQRTWILLNAFPVSTEIIV